MAYTEFIRDKRMINFTLLQVRLFVHTSVRAHCTAIISNILQVRFLIPISKLLDCNDHILHKSHRFANLIRIETELRRSHGISA